LFFMATNFQHRFDPAIKRSGRFDLLICMGPPSLQSKIDDLGVFLKKRTPIDEVKASRDYLRTLVAANPELGQILELFLFGEFKTLLKEFQGSGLLSSAFAAAGAAKTFNQLAVAKMEHNYLRLKDVEDLMKSLNKRTISDLLTDSNLTYDYLKEKKVKLNPLVRYYADKVQSKIQSY